MGHTPGPWKLEHWGDCEIDVYGGEDTLVCTLRGGSTHPDDDSEPDAAIIAAAPDMLAALKAAVSELSGWDFSTTPDPGDTEFVLKCKRIVAKAQGGK